MGSCNLADCSRACPRIFSLSFGIAHMLICPHANKLPSFFFYEPSQTAWIAVHVQISESDAGFFSIVSLFTVYLLFCHRLSAGNLLLQGFTFISRGRRKLVAFYLTVTLRSRMLSAGDSRLQEWFAGGNVNRKSRALLFGQHVWVRRTSPINVGNCKWAAAVLTNSKT